MAYKLIYIKYSSVNTAYYVYTFIFLIFYTIIFYYIPLLDF